MLAGHHVAAIEELGLAETTLVIVSGDHGEGLMQHGILGHAAQLYEEAVRVPLLLRWPEGLPRRRSVPEPVGAIDVAPTALELLGVEPPAGPLHDVMDLHEKGKGVAPDELAEIGKEIFRINCEELWTIGTIGLIMVGCILASM